MGVTIAPCKPGKDVHPRAPWKTTRLMISCEAVGSRSNQRWPDWYLWFMVKDWRYWCSNATKRELKKSFPSGLWVCSMMQKRIRHKNATICSLYEWKWQTNSPWMASPVVSGKMQCTIAFVVPLAQFRCMFNPRPEARITIQHTLISLGNLLSCYLCHEGGEREPICKR